MAERGLEPAPAAVAALPPEVRAQLAELELELSEGRSRRGAGAGRCGGRGGRRPSGRAGGTDPGRRPAESAPGAFIVSGGGVLRCLPRGTRDKAAPPGVGAGGLRPGG